MRPPGFAFVVGFDALAGILFGNGRNDGGVESTGKEYPVRNIGHELALDGSFERKLYAVYFLTCGMAGSGVVCLNGFIFSPAALVPALHLAFASPVVMAGEEGLVFVAKAFKCFQFAAHVDVALVVMAYIEWDDANRVTGDEEIIGFLVIEGESEDAVQFFEEMNAFILI